MVRSHYSHETLSLASAFHLKAPRTKYKHEFLSSFFLSLSHIDLNTCTCETTKMCAQVAFNRRTAQCHRNLHMHPHKGSRVWLVIHEMTGLLYCSAGSM